MNRSQLVAGANAVTAIRPDWNQPGVLAQMQQLDQTWTGTDAALIAHCLTIAGSPNARTPAAFNAIAPTAPAAATSNWGEREPECFICGRKKHMCEQVYERESRRGTPDPHLFESEEQAEANSARRQIDAKVRARLAAEEARRKAKYEVEDFSPPDPRKCHGCGGTLAQTQQDHHPGCVPAEAPT
jgi:hypothetical protein